MPLPECTDTWDPVTTMATLDIQEGPDGSIGHHPDQPPKHVGREKPDRKTHSDPNDRYVQIRQNGGLLSWFLLGLRSSGQKGIRSLILRPHSAVLRAGLGSLFGCCLFE